MFITGNWRGKRNSLSRGAGFFLFRPFPHKLRNSRIRYPLRTGHKRDFANVSFVCLPALPPDFSEGRPGCRWTRKSCGWC